MTNRRRAREREKVEESIFNTLLRIRSEEKCLCMYMERLMMCLLEVN